MEALIRYGIKISNNNSRTTNYIKVLKKIKKHWQFCDRPIICFDWKVTIIYTAKVKENSSDLPINQVFFKKHFFIQIDDVKFTGLEYLLEVAFIMIYTFYLIDGF